MDTKAPRRSLHPKRKKGGPLAAFFATSFEVPFSAHPAPARLSSKPSLYVQHALRHDYNLMTD
jgi:hypothetical protein